MGNREQGCGQGACNNGKPRGRNKDVAGLKTSSLKLTGCMDSTYEYGLQRSVCYPYAQAVYEDTHAHLSIFSAYPEAENLFPDDVASIGRMGPTVGFVGLGQLNALGRFGGVKRAEW